ncbi:MAG: GAP family protein [Prochlorococcaceae cyanobacterium]
MLLLLLLGPRPLQRGGWLVGGWLLTTLLTEGLLLTVGHGLLLTMEKGSAHRTGLDLLAAGALLGLGLKTLLERGGASEATGSRTGNRLERFGALPMPLLLALSCVLQVASPEDLMLYTKAAAALLGGGFSRLQETLVTALFSLATSLLLLLPLLALALGREQVLPLLRRGQQWILANGEGLVGGFSLLLAAYFGWQGIEGLRLG